MVNKRDAATKAVSQARRQVASGNLDQALWDLRRLVTEHPRSGEARLALAQAHLARQEYPDAVAVATLAISLLPGSADPYAVRAYAHLSRGRLSDALDDVEQAVRIDPRRSDIHVLQARIMFARGNSVGAAVSAEMAIDVDSRNADAHAVLAEVAQTTGEWDIAETSARAVLRLRPDDTAAKQLLLRVGHLRAGQFSAGAPAPNMDDTGVAKQIPDRLADDRGRRDENVEPEDSFVDGYGPPVEAPVAPPIPGATASPPRSEPTSADKARPVAAESVPGENSSERRRPRLPAKAAKAMPAVVAGVALAILLTVLGLALWMAILAGLFGATLWMTVPVALRSVERGPSAKRAELRERSRTLLMDDARASAPPAAEPRQTDTGAEVPHEEIGKEPEDVHETDGLAGPLATHPVPGSAEEVATEPAQSEHPVPEATSGRVIDLTEPDEGPDARQLIDEAVVAIDEGNWKTAQQLLEQVVVVDPLYFQHHDDEAQRLYEEVLRIESVSSGRRNPGGS